MFSCKAVFRAVIVVTLTALSFPTLALEEQDRFLDFYEIKTYERGYILKVRFNEAVSYVNHHTENAKKTIKINVRPLLIRLLPLSALHINEIIHAKKNNDVAIDSIRLENSEENDSIDSRNNQLVLTLDFKIPVTFNITQDSGSKSISIYVDQVGQSKKFQQKSLAKTGLADQSKFYAINLESSIKPLTIDNIPKDSFYKKHEIYLTESTVNEEHWNRLRLGYFSTKKKAKLALKEVKKSYPGAWVTRVSIENTAKAKKWLVLDNLAAAKEEEAKAKLSGKPIPAKSKISLPDKDFITPGQSHNKKVQFLMEKGRNAMIDADYAKAIQYYKKAYQLAKGDEKKLALEYLGLARERNSQLAHAKAAYRKYLKDYPTGESAERVNQRLETILTARFEPKKTRAPAGKRKAMETEWETFGTLFQFYRYQQDDSDLNGKSTSDDSLSTNISTTVRRRSEDYDMRFQFDGSHRYDALRTDDKTDLRLSKLYADITSKKSKLHTRVGRQTSHNYGILGRFDGAIVDYPLTNKYKATVSYGYPVRTSKDNSVDTSTTFTGLGLDVSDIIQNWDATFYAIQQTRSGISEREAIGTEARTVSSNHSIFALLDYDTSYSELNTATLIANWLFGTTNVSTLNLVLDYRQAPTLTTSNALIGSTVSTFEDLVAATTEEKLRADAKNNTATYKTITLSGSTPLNETYQLNADITLSTLSSTPIAEGTGTETSYSFQFIGKNVLTENDVSIISVRVSNRSTADTTTYDLNSRIVLNKDWKIRPRFRYDTQTQNTGTNRKIYKPSIRVDYRLKRNFRVELDTGYDFKETTGAVNNKETSFYINLGYIYDF